MKKEDNSKSANHQSNSHIRKQFMKGEKRSFSNWLKSTSKDWRGRGDFWSLFFGPNHERLRVGRGIFCLAFSFVFAVLIAFDINFQSNIQLGDVATDTIRSPFDFQVVDKEATKRRQKDEVKKIPLVLDYYPNIYENKIERFKGDFFQV